MVMRRFILDLEPDGSVKWAEVCERGCASESASSLKRLAIEQAKISTSEPVISYWKGFANGVEAPAALD